MKLLYVKASGFKNIQNDCVLDFTAKSKKTTEDKEYELQEIADGFSIALIPYSATFRSKIKIILMTEFT